MFYGHGCSHESREDTLRPLRAVTAQRQHGSSSGFIIFLFMNTPVTALSRGSDADGSTAGFGAHFQG
ncbi:hypothetical protein BN844_5243 [Pseudomonas sp. SHC52]|nr:hypothetical protein BN844_5243 [Pseudomonas sp. SHC52]